MPEQLVFRAHARLLTMLGEQLIKNERIALVELVKNSYDADATDVSVDFRDFGDNFSVTNAARIVITDNGSGMTEKVVRTAWMNPATPSKAITKAGSPKTALGRVLQGEKGIGRFATFKLGNDVSLVTRAKGTDDEVTLLVDISSLDEQPESEGQRIDYFLDDLHALLDTGGPRYFDGREGRTDHGTQIAISDLRAEWTEDLVSGAFADLDRLQPQLWGGEDSNVLKADFSVRFLRDGADMGLGRQRHSEFQAVLDRAVLRVTNGRFDQDALSLEFDLDDRRWNLDLGSAEVRGLRPFKSHFQAKEKTWLTPECGSFGFEFFVFDRAATAAPEYQLDSEERDLIKEHRIYLYRDGIRVYPYGDPQDDWLEIDAIRGTQSARSIFSNDQTVGFVTISQESNPRLRDKTNREGLLETGRATRDFVVLIQTVLTYLRAKPYEQYSAANRRVREKKLKPEKIDRHIQALRQDFDLPKKALEYLDGLESALGTEREVSAMRVARTEQLAGVGLSVETASHDLISAGSEALRIARHIVDELRLLDLMDEPVFAVAQSLVMRLDFVNARFKDVQGLFVSTRQKRSELDIAQMIRRVKTMYSSLHKKERIEFEIDEPLVLKAVSTDAAVLQCLINLVDNATYWLMVGAPEGRTIRAFAPDTRTLVVTDTGPGVSALDEPFIFEPFYSGKGDLGKGLGLFIAQQNGLRGGFSIALDQSGDPRELGGATFAVRFDQREKE